MNLQDVKQVVKSLEGKEKEDLLVWLTEEIERDRLFRDLRKAALVPLSSPLEAYEAARDLTRFLEQEWREDEAK